MGIIITGEWVCFLAAILISIFFFFDEEPCLDPTDWNIVNILLLLVSVLVVVWDNIIRSRFGQFVFKDQVLVFATFSFWFSLENYSRAIVVIFCFHCLSPLELELLELVEVYQSLLIWYTTQMLPYFLWLIFLFFLSLLTNFYINWHTSRSLFVYISLITVSLLICFLGMLWDFLLSSSSSCLFHNHANSYYMGSRSSLSYDMSLSAEDLFDWHISTPATFIFRFEDSYLFFLQLFNIVALYSCVFVWFFLCLDIILNTTVSSGSLNSAGSHTIVTFLGVGIRWLDHTLWAFFYSSAAVLFVSLRVFLKVSLDFNF